MEKRRNVKENLAAIQLDFHEGTLRLRGVPASFVGADGGSLPMVFDSRDPCFRCEGMHYRSLRALLDARFASGWDDKVLQTHPLALTRKQVIDLRDDQTAAVQAFVDGSQSGLIVMPTGTGKTEVAIEIILRCQTSTLIVVPVRDLMYQWHTRLLNALGVDAGLIGDGVHRVSPLSVTTYESATIHMARIGNRFGLIIFDEVHHLSGQWRSDSARMSAAPWRLGLTATLPTSEDARKELHTLLGPTLYEQDISQAAGKSLAPYKVVRLAVTMDESQLRRYRELGQVIQTFVTERRKVDPGFRWDGIYKLTAMAEKEPETAQAAMKALRASRMRKRLEERAVGKIEILERLFREHQGERILVFVGSNAVARDLSLRFLVPCLLSHCGKRERMDLLEGFATLRYPVLIANQVLDEGVDLPAVKVAVVLGGMGSSRQAVQRLGRILRRTQKGQKAILYEVVTDFSKEVTRSRQRRRHVAYRRKPQE